MSDASSIQEIIHNALVKMKHERAVLDEEIPKIESLIEILEGL